MFNRKSGRCLFRVSTTRAVQPAWPSSEQTPFGVFALSCARFMLHAAQTALFSLGLELSTTTESCRPSPRATRCLCSPLPLPDHDDEPQRKDSPSPWAMEAVVQRCPRSTETLSASFHMISTRLLLKSHRRRPTARRAASGWLGCSPSPFSPRRGWAQNILQQSSPAQLCAEPTTNFFPKSVWTCL